MWEGQKRARISRYILDQERYGAEASASDLPIPFAGKQALLEIADPIQRLKRVRDYLLASA